MSLASKIPVQESVGSLKKLLKTSKPLYVPRIRMLLEMKKEEVSGISKRELMERIGVSSQSIQSWRSLYKTGGIDKLLSHNKKGFKPSVFNELEHQALHDLLHNPSNNITGFTELKEWVRKEFNKDVKYNTLLKYCILNFGAKTKVARKSHINKDEEAVASFKKTLVLSANKQ